MRSGTMTMVDNAPPGTCPECEEEHPPEQPHCKPSLFYQYKFCAAHGWWPTWRDAMAHCPEHIKQAWIESLNEYGVKID